MKIFRIDQGESASRNLPHYQRPLPYRVLSVHSRFTATNIPLEAFVRLAKPSSESGRAADLCVLELHGNAQAAEERFRELNPNQPNVNVFGAAWSWQRPWRFVRLIRFLRSWQPNVVHVHHASSAALVATLAKWCTQAKVITTIHRDFRHLTWLQTFMLRQAMRHSDLVLCNSQSTLRSVIECHPRKPLPLMAVVHNGVDTEQIDATIAASLDPSKHLRHSSRLNIGSVGRMLPIKGFDTVLLAVARCIKSGCDMRLTLVGDGPARQPLEELTRELGIETHVEFTGAVPREQVYQYLGRWDVFVASSRAEGFCNAMVEAMAARCAVVATNIEVFQELLGTEHPHFFAVNDDQELANQLQSLASSRIHCQQEGLRLHQMACKRFSLSACVTRHKEIYRQLAELSLPTTLRTDTLGVSNQQNTPRRAAA